MRVPEAIDDVVIDHPHRLHERVDDRRSHEAESAPAQLLAERE